MTKQEMLDMCYRAHTLPEVRAAQEARSHWLAEHPNDIAVRDMGEMLAMLEEGFTLTNRDLDKLPLNRAGSLALKVS